jgi:transposase-like protein
MRQIDSRKASSATCGMLENRNSSEILWTRMHLLSGRNRALLQMYLEHGNNFCQIASLTGMSPTSVARKIRRIIRRLMDDTYILCLAHRDDFTGRELAMIKDYFVRGLSMARISHAHGVTFYRTRTTVARARQYAAAARGKL